MTDYTDGPIDSALFQNNPAPGGFGGIGGGMRNPTPYFPRRVGLPLSFPESCLHLS